jgi:hypothetical protein
MVVSQTTILLICKRLLLKIKNSRIYKPPNDIESASSILYFQ